MAKVRDTFLHFLSGNLPAGLLHPIRRDPDNRAAEVLSMNQVNASFLNVVTGIGLSSQKVVIDVVFDDENTAVDTVEKVFNLLKARYFTPLFDYTIPAAPVAVGTNVMWDRHRINFKRVPCEAYCHYSCTLLLKFYAL